MRILKKLYWRFGIYIYQNEKLRYLLKPIYRKIVFKHEDKEKNKSFITNGLKIISEFDRALSDNSIPYILMFGSLLGAIREKGFIRHDLDIDIAIWDDDYTEKIKNILNNAGFKLVKSINVDNGKFAREETYIKAGIGIDVFYLYPYSNSEGYVCCFRNFPGSLNFEHSINEYGGLLPVQYFFPIDREIERVLFEGKLRLPIPKNAHEIMKCIYGESYMIPQPNRVAGSFKKFQNILFDKKGIYQEYK